ncbi:MAG TPA: hypothetical protein PK411_14535 [Mesotoga infera]|nr:hypothetical protein [Mesotoga infera]
MREVLSLFFCTKNSDVETFLRDKAITFEKASRARTYLILDEEALTDGKIAIIAYFTVSMKALNLREGISKNVRKHLDGLGNKQGSTFVVYLIGQLGKNDTYRSEIDGKELITRAIATIKEAYEIVGGGIFSLSVNRSLASKSFTKITASLFFKSRSRMTH